MGRHGASVRNQYSIARKSKAPSAASPHGLRGALTPSWKGGGATGTFSAVVRLHVYDFFERGTNDKAGLVGLGAFHAGVEAYGIEWSYGATFAEDEISPQS